MSDAEQPKRVPLRIRLPFASEAEFIERYASHVARGGIFIATKGVKPEGTLLSFELVLADNTRLMRGEGVVHRASTGDADNAAGMLVRFTRVDSLTKALIDRILALRDGVPNAEPPAVEPSKPEPSAPPPPPSAPPPVTGPVALADDVVLGIDLGTTTCRAAVFLDGAPKLVPFGKERSVSMPSVVAWDAGRQELLVGNAAKKYRVERPELSVFGFKRLLGRRARSKKVQALAARFPFAVVADPEGDAGVELEGRVFTLTELAAALLKEIKNAAQDFVGRPLTRAVLCVPAWYTDHQRTAMLEAGKLAGLEVLRQVSEPSAVALAFGQGRGLARKRVLVYDLGGGTFDASVVEITGDDLEVASTGGDSFLGGIDFDERLADALLGTLPAEARGEAVSSRVTVERLREAAEAAKIALSELQMTAVSVPFVAQANGAPVDLRVDVERNFLEQATNELVTRTIDVTRVVLEAAKLTPQHLDDVVLVGGQSRSPAVRQHVEALTGRAPRLDVDPQGAVALGAALAGHAIVQRERGKRGSTLSEVLSVPIGVAVQGGAMRRVLERNTRLPAQKALVVPVKQAQPVAVAVFQGTSMRAEENEYLGTLTCSADRAGELSLTFAVTQDGRLALSGNGPTGQKLEVTFSTVDASDETQAKLFAEAVLPGETAPAKGLLGGLRRLWGNKG